MRYIIKAVDRHVGAPKQFTSAVVYFSRPEYCDFERISSYYIFVYLSFWQYPATKI